MKIRIFGLFPLLTLAFFTATATASGGGPGTASSSAAGAEQLILPPISTDRKAISQLAYIDSHDDVIDKDYAFVVYKEENIKTGEWELKIKGTKVATTAIKPDSPMLRRQMSKAAKKGMNYFVMGFQMKPKDSDARLVENRIYFDESLKPQYLEVRLITRNADGSAKAEQVARVDWPAVDKEEKKLLTAPKSSPSTEIKELAYINSYDVVANQDYAYLAYQETDTGSGKWLLKIKAKTGSSSTIDPKDASLRKDIRAAAKQGKDYVTAGYRFAAPKGDVRVVENRVYFDGALNPTRVEIHLVTREADGSAKEKQVAKFDWPA